MSRDFVILNGLKSISMVAAKISPPGPGGRRDLVGIHGGLQVKGYSTKLELRIDWSEIDLFGHVNNLAILKYVQASRVSYLETIGLMQSQANDKTGPILASISCRFRRPLFYPGGVIVYSRVDEIKSTSFRIQHEVCDDKNQIAAEAQDIIVLYDFVKGTKLAIPDNLRDKIRQVRAGHGT